MIATGPRGICRLAFLPDTDTDSRTAEWAFLQRMWPNAALLRNDASAKATAATIFPPDQTRTSPKAINVLVNGSAFQNKVWRALIEIPFGEIRSYGRLAESIGTPRGARAVGNAAAGNPVAFLNPCHRVIHASGIVGNYRWGSTRKRAILAWEGCRNRKPEPASAV